MVQNLPIQIVELKVVSQIAQHLAGLTDHVEGVMR